MAALADRARAARATRAAPVAETTFERFLSKLGLRIALAVAVLSHAINLFGYPLYLGDEGI